MLNPCLAVHRREQLRTVASGSRCPSGTGCAVQGLEEKGLGVPLWPWTQREGVEVSAKQKG